MLRNKVYICFALGVILLLLGSLGLRMAQASGQQQPPAHAWLKGSLPLESPSPSATVPACSGWQVVPSDNVQVSDNALYGISALSSDAIWAVGNYFTADGYSRTLIEHWNGSAWSVVPSPNPGSNNNWLFGVAAISADDAWAVGWKANTNIQQPLFLHWDGTEWTESEQTINRARVVLQGISAIAANDIWAVGLSCDGPMCNTRITAALHYDGTVWSIVDSPNPGVFDNSFRSVVAVSGGNVWAVGEACLTNGCATSETLIEHWNGTDWSISLTPTAGATRSPLLGVDAIAGEAWAVGEACADADCTSAHSLALHWDGASWQVATTPNPGTVDTHLNAVSMAAANDVWAVGSETSDGETFGNVISHWNGFDWSTVNAPSPGSVDNDLRALARLSSSNIWAAGDQDSGSGELTQVQHYTGSCVEPTSSPTVASPSTPTVTVATSTSTPQATVSATATACTFMFRDVPSGSTFYSYIRCMACRGVVSGYADNTFRPNNNVTRGQLSKIVSNAAGFNDTPGAQMFEDVAPGSTFYDFVQRLASHGYMNGFPCGGMGEPCGNGNLPYFRPNNNATRGQITKIVSNAAGYTEPAGAQLFEDVAPGSTFYDFVQRLASRTIISGYPCGSMAEPCGAGNLPYFRPNNNATRGQTSKIVANTFFPDCQTPSR